MVAPTSSSTPSTFIPAGFDGTRFESIEPLARALLERPVKSRSELIAWLIDRSELDAACSEAGANLYIAMTCNTEDQGVQGAYATYVEEVAPKVKPLAFELDKRLARLAAELSLESGTDGERYKVLTRDTRCEVELFREENVPLETELALLGQKYDQTIGAMTVEFDGREQTMPQMARYMESTDRAQREGAWRAMIARRLRDAGAIDEIYDQMIALRDKVGKNAGFADYVGYAYKAKHRFDYGVSHCKAFHDACERVIVPLIRKLDAQRKSALKLDTLRPWDLSVDIKGRAPLRPFAGGAELVSKSRVVFGRLDPRLSGLFAQLGDGPGRYDQPAPDGGPAYLDLDSRKGKAPGGYQYMRDRQRRPFIFMNAAGMQRDVSTMLHEAGHAFHSMLCVDEPLLAYRSAPIEFCEVASMSMELLTLPHLGGPGGFYPDSKDEARARRHQLEESITILAWIATIDAFQHWVYANPKHSRDDRKAYWLELDTRFGRAVDWSGFDDARKNAWQRQTHLFGHPFYYIEYGIAQLGALGLWLRSLEEGPARAIDLYIKGLSLGGSRPLPDLFGAAGLPFDFGEGAVRRIVERVERELEKLPE